MYLRSNECNTTILKFTIHNTLLGDYYTQQIPHVAGHVCAMVGISQRVASTSLAHPYSWPLYAKICLESWHCPHCPHYSSFFSNEWIIWVSQLLQCWIISSWSLHTQLTFAWQWEYHLWFWHLLALRAIQSQSRFVPRKIASRGESRQTSAAGHVEYTGEASGSVLSTWQSKASTSLLL